jgi:hypothetical protein
MDKTRENTTLVLLLAFYLLCSVRYLPGHPAQSLLASVRQLLTLAPFLLGATLIARAFFHRCAGEYPGWSRLARIYLTLGVIGEFFLGLYNYLAINQPG